MMWRGQHVRPLWQMPLALLAVIAQAYLDWAEEHI